MPSDISNEMLFDRRVIERNLRKGLITDKDVENTIKALPDQTEQAMLIESKVEHHAMKQGPGGSTMISAQLHEEEEELD